MRRVLPLIEKELSPFQPRPALGQTLHATAGRTEVAVRQASRLRSDGGAVRSSRQAAERFPEHESILTGL